MAKRVNKPMSAMSPVQQRCAAQHFGPWAIEPKWFAQAVAAVKEGTFQPSAAGEGKTETSADTAADGYPINVVERDSEGNPILLYSIDRTGIAMVPVIGQMTKGDSSFGGASTIRTRRAIRKAVNDDRVTAILMHIDSPGGTVAGTGDLAADVRAADGIKPVYTYFEDLGASAAYWVGSQGRTIWANPTAEVGSIGTMTYVIDSSGAYEKAGIKVYLVSTGKYKGAWLDGVPVSDDYVKQVQTEIEDLNEHFLAGVMQGRGPRDGREGGINRQQLDDIADGRVFIAAKAKEHGLIDHIGSIDEMMQAISTEIHDMNSEQFRSFAAEHPEDEAVKSLHAAGFKAGKAEGAAENRKEFAAYIAAADGNLDIATEAFAAGAGVEVVEARVRERQAAAARAKADADAQAKALAEKDAEIARLKAAQGTQGAVITTGATQQTEEGKKAKEAPAAGKTPEEQAKAEWAAMSEEARLAWVGESAYVKVRADELK